MALAKRSGRAPYALRPTPLGVDPTRQLEMDLCVLDAQLAQLLDQVIQMVE